MSKQQFCLRWNNHQPNFISVFTTLLNTESLVDVTLAAEGRHVQAHKVVLSACSVYFQSLFIANPSRHPIVILKDVKYTDLRTMVDFMYYGEVNVTQDELAQVLETARTLKIKGLTDMPDAAFTKTTYTDRADLLPTVDHSAWGEQQKGNVTCNMSPSAKRKRRKASTCTSVLTMSRTIDNKVNINPDTPTTCSSVDPVKTDSITVSSVPTVPTAMKAKQQMLAVKDSQFMMMQQQKHSLEDAGIEIVMPESDDTPSDCILNNVDNPIATESASDMTMQGPQWTMLDQGYQRYLATSCHSNVHQNSNINNVLSQDNSVQTFNVPIMNQHLNLDICEYQQEQQHQQQQQASAGGGELETCSPGPSCGSMNSAGVSEAVGAAGPPGVAAPKRRRTSNPQSEENFQRALEAVRFGGIGFCKAARMFGVNNRTLWLEYKKKGYPNNRPSIKNRIKQEHTSPPPEVGEMPSPAAPTEQQLTLLCPPHPVAMMGFVDSRQMDFSGSQNVGRPRFVDDSLNLHNSPINLHGINFNTLQ